jgi:hypothetical protein
VPFASDDRSGVVPEILSAVEAFAGGSRIPVTPRGRRSGTRSPGPGLRARLTRLLAVLVVVGAVGACSSDEPSGEEVGPTTTAVLTPDNLPVFVATTEIPSGVEAMAAYEEGMVSERTATRAEFPEGAVVNLTLIEGQVAMAPIPAGSIVTLSMFGPDPSP